jgi:hypothetical protein
VICCKSISSMIVYNKWLVVFHVDQHNKWLVVKQHVDHIWFPFMEIWLLDSIYRFLPIVWVLNTSHQPFLLIFEFNNFLCNEGLLFLIYFFYLLLEAALTVPFLFFFFFFCRNQRIFFRLVWRFLSFFLITIFFICCWAIFSW